MTGDRMDEALPLMWGVGEDSVLLYHHGQALSRRHFWAQAWQLAESLPQAGAAINLCEDRHAFLLGFVALILRGQVNLLPPDRVTHTLKGLAEEYPGSYFLVDSPQVDLPLPQYQVDSSLPGSASAGHFSLSSTQRVATLFTSGSTGHSLPNHKSWGELYRGTMLTSQVLGLTGRTVQLLATVPPQHMFGLETSILLPLLNDLAVESGRPFYPGDVQASLQGLPQPRWLISTPLHLRACLRAGLEWPQVEGIVSATAPLEAELAAEVEAGFGGTLREIYGSTETGAIATRRTSHQSSWQLHPGLGLLPQADGSCQVQGGHLAEPVSLGDRLSVDGEGRFTLAGREMDLLKIAGKRASLMDLNQQLLAIAGVEDGLFVLPEEAEPKRLMALVVAPELSEQQILAALRERIDAVFLPRPLYRVANLPRNATGKLPREVLWALIRSIKPA